MLAACCCCSMLWVTLARILRSACMNHVFTAVGHWETPAERSSASPFFMTHEQHAYDSLMRHPAMGLAMGMPSMQSGPV